MRPGQPCRWHELVLTNHPQGRRLAEVGTRRQTDSTEREGHSGQTRGGGGERYLVDVHGWDGGGRHGRVAGRVGQ